jgi:hypothetical protein
MTDNLLLNSGQGRKDLGKSDTLYYILACRTKKYNTGMDNDYWCSRTQQSDE